MHGFFVSWCVLLRQRSMYTKAVITAILQMTLSAATYSQESAAISVDRMTFCLVLPQNHFPTILKYLQSRTTVLVHSGVFIDNFAATYFQF